MDLYCTFRLDDLYLGVEVTRVQEVLRQQPLTRVPLAADDVRGLINLRGDIVTAIDLRRRLKLSPREEQETMNIVLRDEDGGVFALVVDAVGDVTEVSTASFEVTPATLDERVRRLVRGVYKLKQGLMLVLDTSALDA
ncbi:MAG: chemotaxis protein CheW [Sandaracinus sp.]|jgi:purine-binding chemotaxis protein CheW|nr:chemotaxis protein CheW [Sandaracinus sp.]MCB9616710.1 chemotaxis protein CheW [Sandaracinus sp.]MCB9623980.1 chemotaxis protein CheW [Sandaracinus sp.]MCB9632502.1 chemotaxis protein CheW [Sandaracinus sp.]